jgi:hypothetical protein
MLRDLVRRSEGPADEGLFTVDRVTIVGLGVEFSDALDGLNNPKQVVSLVKKVHQLFAIRACFLKALTTVIRAFEAYAEEIQTFPSHTNPLLGMLKTLPVMCKRLTDSSRTHSAEPLTGLLAGTESG